MNHRQSKRQKTHSEKISTKRVLQRLRIPNRQTVGIDITNSKPSEVVLSSEQSLAARRHQLVIPFLTKKKGKKHEKKS